MRVFKRSTKAAFLLLAGPLKALNGFRYRTFWDRGRRNVRVQLGPGRRNYLRGWVNVDANAFTGRADIWADLRHRLPFPRESVSAFYSYHVVEHLPDPAFHFRELWRCLEPGGCFRVGGPNAHSGAMKYLEGDIGWFGTFPQHRRSIGGRFDDFLLCANQHWVILTPSFLQELAEDAGFRNLVFKAPGTESQYPMIFDQTVLRLEHESDPVSPHSIIIEGEKPRVTPRGERRH